MVTGVIVLAGAVMTGRFQRIRETVLLRTLGAANVALGPGQRPSQVENFVQTTRNDPGQLWSFLIPLFIFGVFAFAYDGVFIGATWAREMRNLMLLSLAIFLAAWLVLRPFGNAGLWGALLVHYVARGGLQALRYPAMVRVTFGPPVA